MSIIFTFPGPRGSWFHSAGALLPLIFICAVSGIDSLIDLLGKRWQRWNDPSTKPVFTGFLIVLAMVLSALAVNRDLIDAEHQNIRATAYKEAATYMDINDVVMTSDVTLVRHHTGLKTIALPTNDFETLFIVANRYSAKYLILDENVTADLVHIYQNQDQDNRLQLVASMGDEETPIKLYSINLTGMY
jgi:hypothetical protein